MLPIIRTQEVNVPFSYMKKIFTNICLDNNNKECVWFASEYRLLGKDKKTLTKKVTRNWN